MEFDHSNTNPLVNSIVPWIESVIDREEMYLHTLESISKFNDSTQWMLMIEQSKRVISQYKLMLLEYKVQNYSTHRNELVTQNQYHE